MDGKLAVGIKLQCLGSCLDRVRIIPRTQVVPNQVGADLEIQRVQFQRPPALSQRLVEPPHGHEIVREPVMSCRVICIKSNGAAELPLSSLPVAIELQMYDCLAGVRLRKAVVQCERLIDGL